MKTNMKLTAVFEPDDDGGYIAYIEEIPGVNTQGNTLDEAKENILDALKLVMETRRAMAEKDIKKSQTIKRKYIREEIVFA